MLTSDKFKIHKLIGDPKEAFYQLGLKDKNFLEDILSHLEEVTKSDQKVLDLMTQKSLDLYALYASANLADEIPYLDDYLSGSGTSKNDFFKAMTYPEILTALTQFMPLNMVQLACSSIFHLNQNGEMLHLRVLDFPLHDTYAQADRVLLTEFEDKQKVCSLGPRGMPLHSLTAMNESGLSIAIHQKFDRHFMPSGTPIMMIAHEIISKAKTLSDAKRISKKYASIGTWGVQMADSEGNVLSIEYSRGKTIFKEKKLETGEFLYINNQLFDIPFNDAIPASINMYNHCRDNFFKLVEKKALKRKTAFNEVSLLKFTQVESDKLSEVGEEAIKDPELLSFYTPSSVQVACFNLTNKNVATMKGEPPKHSCNGILSIEDIFSSAKIKQVECKTKVNQNHIKGLRHLMQAQYEYDHKNIDRTYHHLQMSSEYLKGHRYHYFANFYFNGISMIHLKNRKSLSDLYMKFENDKPNLPDYMKEQTTLFQIRIQYLLGLPYDKLYDELKHPLLKSVWQNEENFPKWGLQAFLRKTTQLRIDMNDFIYIHSKCDS